MKLLRSFCSVDVGALGYVAAMECRRVQVLRPRVSTSAGQSFAGFGCCDLRVDLAWEAQAEKAAPDVQERQLKRLERMDR
jgi:hypothetical protein